MAGGCVAPGEASAPAADPNAGLLRDFLDGKYDGAGHPLNAKLLEAEVACPEAGPARGAAIQLARACVATLPEGARSGAITANARLRVTAGGRQGTVATLAILDGAGHALVTQQLTAARVRRTGVWIDVPIAVPASGAASVSITPASGATVELDYVELFPTHFGVVMAPGSGTVADRDVLTMELPLGRKLDTLEVETASGRVDLGPTLARLVAAGTATRTDTTLRTIFAVPVGALLPARGEVTELRARGGGEAARVELRTRGAACAFEGDPTGTKVLVTGFQPFPADGWHDNVSGVAVTALDVSTLHGAQVMKLVLPVEYDRAAAAIVEVIERCEPAAVISFGQGGDAIALEETAYNLQDTGEIAGGVPDNRGVIRAAEPIDAAAAATRATLLPLDAIEAALVDLGEAPQHSTDPGRYICNNVMFADIGAMASRGGRAGFIHLPYTTTFDAPARARFARVVAAAIQATVDAQP